MRRSFYFLYFLFFFIVFPNYSQENVENTLDDEMEDVFVKSNSYQNFKVIEKRKLNALRKNILDTISELQSSIILQQAELSSRLKTIDSFAVQLQNVKRDLEESRERENSIEVLGIQTSKSAYSTILWILILILFMVGSFFVYRFSASHTIIREGRLKIEELESEIEEMRRSNLEREQKLRRKLQDEINKNK